MMRWTIGALCLGLAWMVPGVATAQTEQVYYYHTDAVGSVRVVTDAGGQEVTRYDFWPFGQVSGSPAVQDSRMFGGKEHDAESGFDYFGGRHYAGTNGRFTTVDPVLEIQRAIVDPQLWNRYAYARSNPLRFTDPDGRDTIDLAIGFVQGIGQTAVGIVTAPVALATDFRGTVRGAVSEIATDFRLLKYGLANPSEVLDTYSRLATSSNDADQRALGKIFGGATLVTALIVSPAAEARVPTGANILDQAANGTGNFGLGSARAADAMATGKAWVGEGYRVASDGKTLVSQDGLRQFRPPSLKPKLGGRTQANFEQRSIPKGRWESNGHLDIIPE